MANASPVGAVLPEQPKARYSVPALEEYDDDGRRPRRGAGGRSRSCGAPSELSDHRSASGAIVSSLHPDASWSAVKQAWVPQGPLAVVASAALRRFRSTRAGRQREPDRQLGAEHLVEPVDERLLGGQHLGVGLRLGRRGRRHGRGVRRVAEQRQPVGPQRHRGARVLAARARSAGVGTRGRCRAGRSASEGEREGVRARWFLRFGPRRWVGSLSTVRRGPPSAPAERGEVHPDGWQRRCIRARRAPTPHDRPA